MIKTPKMAIRESLSNYPHISSANVLVGNCGPLKHFLCHYGITGDDTAGASMVDAVGGLNFAITGTVETTPGYIDDLADTNVAFTSGTIDLDSTTEDLLIVMAGRPSASTGLFRVDFGNIGAGTVGISARGSNAGAGCSIRRDTDVDTTASLSGLPTGGATPGVIAAGLDRDASLTGVFWSGASATLVTQTAATTNTTGDTLAFTDVYSISAAKMKAIGAFKFTGGLPSNWKAKAAWMGWEWLNGNYVFPSEWASL